MLPAKKFNLMLSFSILFCWFFSVMVGYTSLDSNDVKEIVLKGVVVGVGFWCGMGLLKRKGQVLWFTVSLCLYAIYGSLAWLYDSLLVPLMYGREIIIGPYEYLGFLYIVSGSLVIWFLLNERTRLYLK
jgi:hypothetical protein